MIKQSEKETHINMSTLDNKVRIYTTENRIMRKLDKYVEESESWKIVEVGKVKGEIVSKTYEGPKELLLIRKKKRVISDEQKQAASERLKAYWSSKDDEESFEDENETEGQVNNDETPRLEPQKTKPKYEKVKSIIAEMERS